MKLQPIMTAIFFTMILLFSISSCDNPFAETCDCEITCAGDFIPNTICEECVQNRSECADAVNESDVTTYCGSADATYTVSTSMCM